MVRARAASWTWVHLLNVSAPWAGSRRGPAPFPTPMIPPARGRGRLESPLV